MHARPAFAILALILLGTGIAQADPAKDAGQTKAQACGGKARGRFAKAHAKAVAAAAKKGGSCELVGGADTFVDRLLVSPLDHLRTAELLAAFVPATAGKGDATFRAALLRASGGFSAQLFGAESKNAGGLAETQITLNKLGTRRAASRSRFDAQVARARTKAAQAGLTTPSPVDANGGPLSVRIASGKPYSSKTRSN